MKQKRILAIIGTVLFIAVVITPVTASAALKEVVEITGSGTVRTPEPDDDGGESNPETSGTSSDVGAVSKISGLKTGDRLGISVYLIAFLSSLAALLVLLLIRWHLEDVREPQFQKY